MFVVAAPGDDRRWFAKTTASGAESWFYREVGPSFAWVPACVPVTDAQVTITDYLENVPSVADVATEQPTRAIAMLVSLGPLLAELHAWSPSTISVSVPVATPALPQLDPVHVLAWLDGTVASTHVLHSVHSRGVLCEALRRVLDGEGPRGLIHGDLKADNILYRPSGPVVLDWELSGDGPVAWDLGSILGSILAIWIEGVDFTAPSGSWLEATVVSYAEVCGAIRRFMADYIHADPRQVPAMPVVLTHAAAWLVVRSWAESLFMQQVDPRHLLRLVVAEGLLRNPSALFGAASW